MGTFLTWGGRLALTDKIFGSATGFLVELGSHFRLVVSNRCHRFIVSPSLSCISSKYYGSFTDVYLLHSSSFSFFFTVHHYSVSNHSLTLARGFNSYCSTLPLSNHSHFLSFRFFSTNLSWSLYSLYGYGSHVFFRRVFLSALATACVFLCHAFFEFSLLFVY